MQGSFVDVAWAAGLFEGEGWFGPRGKTSAEAVLGMTDRDVVERFAAVMGFGTISVEPRADGHKTLYRWSASNAKDVRTLIGVLRPYFGDRRRAAADALWQRTERCLGSSRAWTRCAKGHPYTETDTYTVPKTGYRQCRICQRERDRKQYARKKEHRMAQVKKIQPGKPGQTTPPTQAPMSLQRPAPTLPVTGKGPTSPESLPPK